MYDLYAYACLPGQLNTFFAVQILAIGSCRLVVPPRRQIPDQKVFLMGLSCQNIMFDQPKLQTVEVNQVGVVIWNLWRILIQTFKAVTN